MAAAEVYSDILHAAYEARRMLDRAGSRPSQAMIESRDQLVGALRDFEASLDRVEQANIANGGSGRSEMLDRAREMAERLRAARILIADGEEDPRGDLAEVAERERLDSVHRSEGYMQPGMTASVSFYLLFANVVLT